MNPRTLEGAAHTGDLEEVKNLLEEQASFTKIEVGKTFKNIVSRQINVKNIKIADDIADLLSTHPKTSTLLKQYLENLTPVERTEYLLIAAYNNQLKLAQILLNAGATDGTTPNDPHNSALITAVRFYHMDMVALLLTKPNDTINIQASHEGYTVLMLAVLRYNIILTQLLLDAKADLETKNNLDQTALDLAMRGLPSNDGIEIITFLIQKGAKIHHPDKFRSFLEAYDPQNSVLMSLKTLCDQLQASKIEEKMPGISYTVKDIMDNYNKLQPLINSQETKLIQMINETTGITTDLIKLIFGYYNPLSRIGIFPATRIDSVLTKKELKKEEPKKSKCSLM